MVLGAVFYLRCPGKETGYDPAASGAAIDPVRVAMEGDGSLRKMSGGDAGPLGLKRWDRTGTDPEPAEVLGRMKARIDLLEERVEQLNEKLDLLLVLSSGQDGREGDPDVPPGAAPRVKAPPLLQPKSSVPAERPAPVPDPPAETGKPLTRAGGEPTPEKAPDQAEKPIYHMVEPGENLYRIGLKYNLNVNQLMKMNGISKGQSIRPGKRLRVSGP